MRGFSSLHPTRSTPAGHPYFESLSTHGSERHSTLDEPNHDDLCEREQRFLLKAIDEDVDLSAHMGDAVKSLRIVLAADQSVRTGEVVRL